MSIEYLHRIHPRSRTVRISISHQGEVVVTSPRGVSDHQIKKFIHSNQTWIEQALHKIKKQPLFGVTPDWVMIFGQKYHRHTTDNSTQTPGCYLDGNVLTIVTTYASGQSQNTTQTQNLLKSFLKSTAAKYILPRTHQFAELMDTSFRNITLREQKTRWGSCSSQGNLNFNWRLVHCPTGVIDYVIVHELAHRSHMNHSPSFWQLVSRFAPDYPQQKGWLKRHGLSLG